MIGSKQKYKFCNILFSTLLPCHTMYEFHMLDQCQDFMTHILLYLRRSKDQYLRKCWSYVTLFSPNKVGNMEH